MLGLLEVAPQLAHVVSAAPSEAGNKKLRTNVSLVVARIYFSPSKKLARFLFARSPLLAQLAVQSPSSHVEEVIVARSVPSLFLRDHERFLLALEKEAVGAAEKPVAVPVPHNHALKQVRLIPLHGAAVQRLLLKFELEIFSHLECEASVLLLLLIGKS